MIGTLPAGLLTGTRFPLSKAVTFRSACKSAPRLGSAPAFTQRVNEKLGTKPTGEGEEVGRETR